MAGIDPSRQQPQPAGGVYGMFGSAAARYHPDEAAAAEEAGPSGSSRNAIASATTTYGAGAGGSVYGGGGAGVGAAGEWERLAQEEAAAEARCLDLAFIMDATGSMGSYIASATKNIETICEQIIASEKLAGPDAFRVALVAYRDHPPQDHTYIVKSFDGFTTDVSKMKEHLNSLYASGGGDGPEAVTAALKAALDLDWRPHATKVAVLIADAPPHGIGEYGDGFPQGSPDGYDPLQLARAMAAVGITVNMVACEPALSGYTYAADFFQGLVRTTGGQLLPLTTASLLAHVVIGACGEAMDMERLHREVGDAVLERLRSMSLSSSATSEAPDDVMESVTRELHQSLRLRNERTKQLVVESIYRDSEESRHNIEVWSRAPDLATAKPHLKKVVGSRLSDEYLRTRAARSSYQPYTPFPHPRSPDRSLGLGKRSQVGMSSSDTTTSPGGGAWTTRRVVSDFSAFSARPGMSFVGTPASPPNDASSLTSPPPPPSGAPSAASASLSGAAFSAPRTTGGAHGGGDAMDDDDDDDDMMVGGARSGASGGRRTLAADDDDEDDAAGGGGGALPTVRVSADGDMLEVAGDDGQRLAYRQGDISLEQVRRLARLSAFRGGLS